MARQEADVTLLSKNCLLKTGVLPLKKVNFFLQKGLKFKGRAVGNQLGSVEPQQCNVENTG